MQKVIFLIMKTLETVSLALHEAGGSYFKLFYFSASSASAFICKRR